jgi:serralysin
MGNLDFAFDICLQGATRASRGSRTVPLMTRRYAKDKFLLFGLGGLAACGGAEDDNQSGSESQSGALPLDYRPPASTYTTPTSPDANLFALLTDYVDPYWVAALTSEDSSQIKANYSNAGNMINYAFPTSIPDYLEGTDDAVEWRQASANVEAAFEAVFAGVEAVFAVEFVRVTNTSAVNVISISQNTQLDTSGYAYFPTAFTFLGGDVFISNNYSDPQDSGARTNFEYELVIHELGHALGFKHPFEEHGAETTVLSETEDNSYWTVLTYTDFEAAYDGFFRPFDLMALADMFGVNPDYRADDDVYEFSSSVGTFVIDGGGIDTVSASGRSASAYIDLRSGMHSYLGAKAIYITSANQLTISAGSLIENATGGSDDDYLIGNDGSNILFGGAGSDRLFGGNGRDQLWGGSGDDVIDFSETVSAVDRLILEGSASLNGTDTVYSFAQGAAGDVVHFLPLVGAELLAVVVSTLVPIANVSDTILRLATEGLDTATQLDTALSAGGAFSGLSLETGREALVLTAESQATGEDQHLFHILNSGLDILVTHLVTFAGNYLDIDSWHGNNFS